MPINEATLPLEPETCALVDAVTHFPGNYRNKRTFQISATVAFLLLLRWETVSMVKSFLSCDSLFGGEAKVFEDGKSDEFHVSEISNSSAHYREFVCLYLLSNNDRKSDYFVNYCCWRCNSNM